MSGLKRVRPGWLAKSIDDAKRAVPIMSENLFDLDQFARRIVARVTDDGLSYRSAAPFAGVSYSTLHRCASGRGLPDVESYLRIERWLATPTHSDKA